MGLVFVLCPAIHLAEAGRALGLTIAEPGPAISAGGPNLTVVRTPLGVELTGKLPDEATRRAVVDRAGELYGGNGVIDNLTVQPGLAEAPWANPTAAPRLVPAKSVRVEEYRLVAGGEGVKVTGRAVDGDAKAEALQSLAGVTDLEFQVEAPTVPAETVTDAKLNRRLRAGPVQFRAGSAELTPVGRKTLDAIAQMLSTGTENFEVQGHTDSSGKPDENLTLSQRRAQSSRDYLVQRGVAASRLTSKGYGDTRPRATNASLAGRRLNRRIELHQN